MTGSDRAARRGTSGPARSAPTLPLVSDTTHGPVAFQRAVRSLERARPRAEVQLERIPAPQRLAPWSYAIGAVVNVDGEEVATARLVLLHDPDGQDAWGGTLRVVVYVRAQLEVEFAGDPLLPGVGWSWLTESLQAAGAQGTALGGTVTQTSSARFGDIAGPERSDDVEIRASWTPVGGDLRAHAEAFCELIAVAAGLPPVGVAALDQRHG